MRGQRPDMSSKRSMGAAWKGGAAGATLLVACAAAACGSGSTGFVTVGIGPAEDAGDTGSNDGGTPASDATAGKFFTGTDSSVAAAMFACQPGTYTGTFTTMVTSDAGGLATLFSFNWTGALSITLVGEITTTTAGEFASSTLTIAPGAKLAGMDSMGGRFSADLSGQLDCPSKKLTATVANGSYNYFGSGDAGGISMQGSMSATYDGTTTPPALSMGDMDLSSPQLMGIAALGTWTAALQ
jgi:hypothetical protein